MEILRCDLENKEGLEQLVDMKLAHMGIFEDPNLKDDAGFHIAIRGYFIDMLNEHLSNSEDGILTGYFDDSELALWGFAAGWKAALQKV